MLQLQKRTQLQSGHNTWRIHAGVQHQFGVQLGHDLVGYSRRHDRLQDGPDWLQLFRATGINGADDKLTLTGQLQLARGMGWS